VSAGSERGGDDGADRRQCTACRGTGRLISNLGGRQHEVTCPWCGGSGSFQPGRDAQEAGPTDSPG
jgi:DnaJ-class molecular chaperone